MQEQIINILADATGRDTADFSDASQNLFESGQAPFCLCTLRMVSNHPEGTFGRLRYPFGGDRPSQTPRLALSIARITGTC